MSNKRIFHGLSKAKFDKPDQNKHISNIAQNIAILTGQSKDKESRAVLYRDLKALGLLGGKGGTTNITNFGVSDGGGIDETVDFPTQPTNVSVNGAFTTVSITWDQADYSGHKHTEIWRNTVDVLGNISTPEITQGEAVLVGTTGDSIYIDGVNENTEYYYWIRFVNKNDEAGAVQSASGLYVKTNASTEIILDEINEYTDEQIALLDASFQNALDLANLAIGDVDGKIDTIKSELDQDVDDLIQGQTGLINELNTNYYNINEYNNQTQIKLDQFLTANIQPNFVNLALLENEYRTAVEQDQATTEQINSLFTTVEGEGLVTLAFLEQEYRTKSSQDQATTEQINTALSSIELDGYVTTAFLQQEYKTEVETDNAIASTVDSLRTEIFEPNGDVKASFIGQVRISQTDLNSAVAAGIDSYSVSYNNDTYSIEEITSATVDNENNYELQWGIKATFNELNYGVGFIQVNGVTSFAVRTDTFSVFNVLSGEFENAFTVQDGQVSAKRAVIGEAQFGTLLVQNQALFEGDVLVNSKLTGARIHGAEISAGDLYAVSGGNGLSISPSGSFAMWYGSSGAYNPDQEIDTRSISNARFALKHNGGLMARGIDIYDSNNELIMSANGEYQGAFFAKGLKDDIYDSLLFENPSRITLQTNNDIKALEATLTAQPDYGRNFVIDIQIEHESPLPSQGSEVQITLRLNGINQMTVSQSTNTFPSFITSKLGCYVPPTSTNQVIDVFVRRIDGQNTYIAEQLILATVFKSGNSFLSYGVGNSQPTPPDGGGVENDNPPVTQNFSASAFINDFENRNFSLEFNQGSNPIEFELTNVAFTRLSGSGIASQSSSINDTTGVLSILVEALNGQNSQYRFSGNFRCRNSEGWSNQSSITILFDIEGNGFDDFSVQIE
jgi:hypothetical protein